MSYNKNRGFRYYSTLSSSSTNNKRKTDETI